MDDYEFLKHCPLFVGIDEADLSALLSCLNSMRRKLGKNDFIFIAGDTETSVGIVLSGNIHIIQEDFWGNRTILSNLKAGDLFGEAFSCTPTIPLPVSVIAADTVEVLLIDYRQITATCPKSCSFHRMLIDNMLSILAQKNIMLTQKMEIISRRTTKRRLLAYLSSQAISSGKNRFTIPFNRQQLADYLAVERSAMSAEISKLQTSGLIKTHRSEFELLTSVKYGHY